MKTRDRQYNRVLPILLRVSLVLLSSCSTSTISLIANEKDTASSSQSQLTHITSEKPAKDKSHTHPTRPFPDFPPNYLQFPPQWLLDDFNNGNFTVGNNNIAANYQEWYQFIRKVNKNKDASLTIQTFDIESSKEVNDSTRYIQLNRYRLSVSGNQASWSYLSDDKSKISGRLSLGYDENTGIHEVFLGDTKVFEFTYFPSELRQAALYFGYTLMEELPVDYTGENAILDGCLVIENGVIQNINVLTKSGDPFSDDMGYFIRIFFQDEAGITIMDIGSYNERVCISADYSRHYKCDDMEDMYITTYYDNYAISIGGGDTPDLYELALISDFSEPIFILKNMPYKKN